MNRIHFGLLSLGLLALQVGLPVPALAADVSPAITAQGVLRQSAGGLQDGVFSMTFRLFDTATGGTARYQETQMVDVDSGVFTVTLGPTTGDPTSFRQLFRDTPGMWLEVEVAGDPNGALPRISLGTSPYAFHAQSAEYAATAGTAGMCTNAQSLGGFNSSDFQRRLSVPEALVLSAPGGANLSLAAGCGANQILKFIGGRWICSSDETGSGGGVTYTAQPPLEITAGNSIAMLPGGVTSAFLAVGAVDSAAILNESIQGADIFPGTITGFHLLDGTVATGDLAAGAVTTDRIQPGAVTADRLAPDAVNSSTIADLSITTADLGDGAIITVKIQDGAVTNNKLALNAVASGNIQTNAVTNTHLADNAVSSNKILDGTVSTLDLADSSITTNKVADGAISSAKILDGTVSTGDLADSAVNSAKIADNTVASGDILDGTIATGDLADNAVNSAKIADNTVSSGDILDGTIANGDLADNAVNSAKIADNTVSSGDILDGTIANGDLADNAVNSAKIADNTVSSGDILDGTIANGDLADNAVNSAKIADNTVSSTDILDGTITNADLSALFTVADTSIPANIARLDGSLQTFTQPITLDGAITGVTVTNTANVGTLMTPALTSRGAGMDVNLTAAESFDVYVSSLATPELSVQSGVVEVDGNLVCGGNVSAVGGAFTGAVSGASFTSTGAVQGATVSGTTSMTTPVLNATTSVNTPTVVMTSGAFTSAVRPGTNTANSAFTLPPANATVNSSELIGNTDGTTAWRSPRAPVEAISAANDGTNSTTDVLVDNMQLTGLTGTYVITFSTTVDCDNRDATVTIYNAGAAVAGTPRTVRSNNVRVATTTQTLLTGLSNATVEVRGRVNAGNCTFRERSLIAMPF